MPGNRLRDNARIKQPEHGVPHPSESLLACAAETQYRTILADPPWRFYKTHRKDALEHRGLSRYFTMTLDDIYELPVATIAAEQSHLYLWVPNGLLAEGLATMQRWGYTYKSNIVWYKICENGGLDERGTGFYFHEVTELILFGVRGKNNRTLSPGRTQTNIIATPKREDSRKPDEAWSLIERCSPAPRLEMFARFYRSGWDQWGDQVEQTPLTLLEP